ncbi:MAG: transglutaminase domain-containing protein [Candidatus Woesearchaeota archaeon]
MGPNNVTILDRILAVSLGISMSLCLHYTLFPEKKDLNTPAITTSYIPNTSLIKDVYETVIDENIVRVKNSGNKTAKISISLSNYIYAKQFTQSGSLDQRLNQAIQPCMTNIDLIVKNDSSLSKNKTRAAKQIIDYIHTFVYSKDENRSRIKTSIETIVEGCGNSKDLSVLAASLLHSKGIDAIFVRPYINDTPQDHILIGIKGNFKGDATTYNGEKYFLVELTGTKFPSEPAKWKIGELPNNNEWNYLVTYNFEPIKAEYTDKIEEARIVRELNSPPYEGNLNIKLDKYLKLKTQKRAYIDNYVVDMLEPATILKDSEIKDIANFIGKDKSDEQAAQKIIDFVNSQNYINDKYQSRIKTPIETIVEGGGDCEDLSVFALSLLRARKIDAVYIVPFTKNKYQKHIFIGIAGNFEGTYITHNEKKYFITETTAQTKWKIGENSDEYDSGIIYDPETFYMTKKQQNTIRTELDSLFLKEHRVPFLTEYK